MSASATQGGHNKATVECGHDVDAGDDADVYTCKHEQHTMFHRLSDAETVQLLKYD